MRIRRLLAAFGVASLLASALPAIAQARDGMHHRMMHHRMMHHDGMMMRHRMMMMHHHRMMHRGMMHHRMM